MSTAPVILVMGHRLCSALLVEAEAALEEDLLGEARTQLQQFVSRMQRHMLAEHEVLFPKLVRMQPDTEAAISAYRQEHDTLDEQMRACLSHASAGDTAACMRALKELSTTFRAHCDSEERFVYGLAQRMNQSDVQELAATLAPMSGD